MRNWKRVMKSVARVPILNSQLSICLLLGCAQQQGTESRQASEPRAGTLTAQPIDTQYTFTIIGNQPGVNETTPAGLPIGETPIDSVHDVATDWTVEKNKTTASARAVVQNVTIEINTAGGSAADSAARAQAEGAVTSNPNATLAPETTLSAQLPIAMGLSARNATEGTAAGQGGQARGGNDQIDQSGDAKLAAFDPLGDRVIRTRLRDLLVDWITAKIANWLKPATPASQPAGGN